MALSVIPQATKLEVTAKWAAETLKVALFTAAYSEASTVYSVTNECTNGSGAGYTAGGKVTAFTSEATGVDAKLAGTTTQWTSLTTAARYAVVYSTAAGLPIRGIFYLGTDYPCSNGTLTITWSANGLIKVSS
jgi:hypothetical protein